VWHGSMICGGTRLLKCRWLDESDDSTDDARLLNYLSLILGYFP
jgi:hypothetical protein